MKTVALLAGILLSLLFSIAEAQTFHQEPVSGSREEDEKRAAPIPSDQQLGLPRFPLSFIENRGQIEGDVDYYVLGSSGTVYFNSRGMTLTLQGHDEGRKTRWAVKLDFLDAGGEVDPQGRNRRQALFSYFKGDRADWRRGIPTYAELVYQDLWPGIDLCYSGDVDQLKYTFVVRPGADPDQIRLRYRGISGLSVRDSGELAITTALGEIEDGAPTACQTIGNKERQKAVRYRLVDEGDEGEFTYGFEISDLDPDLPLVIDPVLHVYCGYVGGETTDTGRAVAVDRDGAAYLTGETWSSEPSFPVFAGPDLTFNGYGALGGDAFIAKVSPDGTHLEYCGFIGGEDDDYTTGVAVDESGHAYVVGYTRSTQASFPVRIGPDLTYNGNVYPDVSDAFIAKVTPDGTDLVYCGYIGGIDQDRATDVALDDLGQAFVSGRTSSRENTFPVLVGPDLTHNGVTFDGFVAKVNADGSGLLFCGYIGGDEHDEAHSIAVDRHGDAYVTGLTVSTESTFPVLIGPDLSFNGGFNYYGDAFVAKVQWDGTGLLYCGYIGGLYDDFATGIAVDDQGSAYVTGTTQSDELSFPVLVGPDLTFNCIYPYRDAFVAKVMPTGEDLLYCGYIGGELNDQGCDIALDRFGCAYITGRTYSCEDTFPIRYGPDLSFNGGIGYEDAFVAKIAADGEEFDFCGYIGGDRNDIGYGIAVDDSANVFVTGETGSSESTFPVTVGPYLQLNAGLAWGPDDAFIARLVPSLRCDPTILSAGAGGSVVFSIRAGEDNAYRRYLLLAGRNGVSPGTLLPGSSVVLPLNVDNLTYLALSLTNSTILRDFSSLLDAGGAASAQLNLPPISGCIGTEVVFAFCLGTPLDYASNPVAVTIVP